MSIHALNNGARLNPFAFPSDTTFRFILLIIYALCSDIAVYGVMWSSLFEAKDKAVDTCVLQVVRNPNILSNLPDYASVRSLVKNIAQCTTPLSHHLVPFRIIGIALLLGVAFGIYWFFPVWKIRRDKLQLLTDQDVPEISACLTSLCREAGLSSPPVFVWNPLKLNSGTLAFGRLGRYYVSLSGGLIMQFYTDRPAFQAVVRHELAHLQNADVNLTYFTMAIWWAFIATALIPGTISLLWRDVNLETYVFLFHLAASTTVIYLTRNAVLRARELYADVRASAGSGSASVLVRVLQAIPLGKEAHWRALFQLHPHPHVRILALADTSRLFRMTFWDAFGAGIAVIIALMATQGSFLVGFLAFDLSMFGYIGMVATIFIVLPLLFFSLVIGAVGLGVARETFASLMQNKVPHGAGRLGIALALGMLLGFSPQALFSFVLVDKEPVFVSASTIIVFGGGIGFCLALLLISLFIIFRWIASVTSAWLEVMLHRPSPRLIISMILIVGTSFVALWFVTLLFFLSITIFSLAQSTSNLGIFPQYSPLQSVTALIFTVGTVTFFPTAITLWAVPLLARLWQRREHCYGSSWALLDENASEDVLPHQTPLRPVLALLIGFGSGFPLFLMIIAMRFSYFRPAWIATVDKLSAQIIFYGSSALIQAIAAVVTASWIKRLGGIHGLFAAFIAGTVIASAWIDTTKGPTSALMEFLDWFLLIHLYGLCLAVPAALSVSFLAARIRRLKTASQLKSATTQ